MLCWRMDDLKDKTYLDNLEESARKPQWRQTGTIVYEIPEPWQDQYGAL